MPKLSYSVTFVAWGSLFFESWLLILRLISSSFTSWGFWIFFLLVAMLSSSLQKENRK